LYISDSLSWIILCSYMVLMVANEFTILAHLFKYGRFLCLAFTQKNINRIYKFSDNLWTALTVSIDRMNVSYGIYPAIYIRWSRWTVEVHVCFLLIPILYIYLFIFEFIYQPLIGQFTNINCVCSFKIIFLWG
jgi:hypothetical protein